MRPAAGPTPVTQSSRLAQVAVSYAIVTLMLTCFAASLVGIGKTFLQDWDTAFLVPLACLAALEALISRRLSEDISGIVESILFRASELVVFAVLLKLAHYLSVGLASLPADLAAWENDFLGSFFDPSYFTSLLVLLAVWMLAGIFADHLIKLEEDPEVFELERTGFITVDRANIRRGLVGLVFILGAIMLVAATLLNSDLSFVPQNAGSLSGSVALLLVYFLLGFVLLAQTQYAVMAAHWYISNVETAPGLSKRWLLYALALIAAAAALVALLPTRYTISLLDLLQVVINAVMVLLTILQFLILYPLMALFNWLMRLMGRAEKPLPPPELQIPQSPPQQPLPPAGSNPLWDTIRSILFWGVFILIIVLALRYFFSQRQDLIMAARRLPVWRFLSGIWQGLRGGFRRVGVEASAAVSRGWQRILAAGRRLPTANPFPALFNRLPPRQRVLLTYLLAVRSFSEGGFPRRANQTPNEYAVTIAAGLPDALPHLETLTRAFEEARYTRHPINAGQAEAAAQAADGVRAAIQAWIEQQAQPGGGSRT